MAVAHVQDTPLFDATSSPGSTSFPANTTVGNVVCLMVQTNGNIVSTGRPIPSGAGVATWILAPFPTSGTVSNVCMYYGLVTSSGSATISLTDPSSLFWGAGASEFSGLSTTLIDHINYDETGVTGSIPVGPLTPTAAGQLAFISNGNINGSNQSPYTAGSPWTAGTAFSFSNPFGDYGQNDWLITTSTSALNTHYTYGGAVGMAAVAGILLDAAGPAAGGGPSGLVRAPSFYVRAGPRFMPAPFLPEPYAQAGVDTILTGVATGLALAAPAGSVAVTLPGATAALTLAASAGVVAATLPGTTAALVLAAPPGSVNTTTNISIAGVTAGVALSSPPGTVSATLPGVTASIVLAAPPGTVSATIPGTTAHLTIAAPPGGVNVTLPGTTSTLVLAAPAGTVSTGSNVSITGPTAAISLAATAGTVAVTLPGASAALAIAAPPGTVSATIPGTAAHLTLAAPPGGVNVTLPGVAAALVLAAPAGTVTIPGQVSIIGASVGLQLSAQAGAASVTLPGATARYVIAAPPGSTSAGIGGATARYVLAAPPGSVAQGAPPPFTVGVLTGTAYAPAGTPATTGPGDTAVSAPTATLTAADRRTGGPT